MILLVFNSSSARFFGVELKQAIGMWDKREKEEVRICSFGIYVIAGTNENGCTDYLGVRLVPAVKRTRLFTVEDNRVTM